jgi:hypothetical protein
MAQIFELQFNPKGKEDLIFDSFCYEPENVYEKRLGSLYLLGELKNALPENSRFLDKLSQTIKGNFYDFKMRSTEKSFKQSLKRANEFLEKEVQQNNTHWLGNLNFAVISLKRFNLNFTKVGNLKISLLRGGQMINIGKKLDLEDIEPYPLKIFSNVVSGKLEPHDIIFIATEEVFSIFSEAIPLKSETNQKKETEAKSMLEEIATLIPFDEKQLKKILRAKEKTLSETSGICLLIVLKPKALTKRAISFERETPLFSISEILKPVTNKFRIIPEFFKTLHLPKPKIQISLPFKKDISFEKTKLPQIKTKKLPQISFQGFLEKINIFQKIRTSRFFRKKFVLIASLILLLILGFFIFRMEEPPLKRTEEVFPQIHEKITLVENFLILKDEAKANSLLKEAWQEVFPLTEKENPLKREAEILKEVIKEKLEDLNKLEKIENPQVLFEFSRGEFSPQKLIILDKTLYFFNPSSNTFFKFEQGKKVKLEGIEGIEKAIPFDEDSILSFLEPNKLIFLNNDELGEPISLKLPYLEFNLVDLSSFAKNVYLMDNKEGEIVKYASPLVINKDFPKIWLNQTAKKTKEAKSMAIDGSIWVLNQENSIDRFYAGAYLETLTLDFFPFVQNLDKILINRNLPYIFISESKESRIIIIDKSGNLVLQLQSDNFNNLKDFTVSDDGTIYILNDLKIYQVKI